MHDSTEREARRRLLPFPFSPSSPGDLKAPEETSVAASLPKLPVQAYGVRVDGGVWVYLRRWVLSWVHQGRHVARNRFSKSPADLGTECPPPSAAQQKAVARLSDDIRDFLQGLPVPAPDWGSVLIRSRLNYDMREMQASGNEAWNQLASGLPPHGRAADVRLPNLRMMNTIPA